MADIEKQEILLESGTNEMELLEFTIAGDVFGINVAKIREIMMAAEVKPMPHSHPSVEGVFKPRDIVITVFNLPQYLDLDVDHDPTKDLFIVTYFNQVSAAFRVHSVEGIRKISWRDIKKPERMIYGGAEGVATGLAEFDGRLITILDLEKIISDIAPETGMNTEGLERFAGRDIDAPILMAEDSNFLMEIVSESLNEAGFHNLRKFDNGQDLWDYVSAMRDDPEALKENVSLIITDIEMPQMDGHRLTRLLKEDHKLKHIPVVIFTSMMSDELRRKGVELGADEQLAKPEIGKLVGIVDDLLYKKAFQHEF